MTAEVFGAGRWHAIGPGVEPAKVGESDLFRLQGVPSGCEVVLGGSVAVRSDRAGRVQFKLHAERDLRGHLGMISIAADGEDLGEVEIVPDKMSLAAYRRLRADLETVWTGLTLDPGAVSTLQAGPPPLGELWRRLEEVVRQIAAQPHEVLMDSLTFRRAELVRSRREMTVATMRARSRGGIVQVRTLERSTATADNAMVVDTLRRVRAYARQRGDAHVESQAHRWLASAPFDAIAPLRGAMSTYVLDRRYRQVQHVRQLLLRPDLAPVEGPGEVRLGVRSLIRLYEYWVYLQVLLQARAVYGDPVSPGFGAMRVETDRGPRIEIPDGTSIEFPGDVHVAFTPRVKQNPGRSWQGLQHVVHPDRTQRRTFASTPDVVVLRRGADPQALVLDAKYVARGLVELSAAQIHHKYARMTLDGVPVVSQVIAIHPHSTLQARSWAGYGHVSMNPEYGVARLPLPPP